MSAGTRPDPLGLVMLAFEGITVPDSIVARLGAAPAAGMTLFSYDNVESPAQVRALTDAVQAAAHRRDPDAPPLLVAADQEGGQLLALGDGTTPFPGNMALGATGDAGLAERVGRAIGLECRAVGVNVVNAPVCDVADNPENPGIGIRSFGADPARVAEMAAATVRGLRSAGVAATAKHFPGLGGVALDSHHALSVLPHDRERLDAVELPPFRAAIAAGADGVMSAHVALPAISGDASLPATLSAAVMRGLLRDELRFDGVAITDALDMRALPQGAVQAIDAIAALRAGEDLLLLAPGEPARLRIEEGLLHAARRGLLDSDAIADSLARVDRLRRRAGTAPAGDVAAIRTPEHLAIARELADRSITLVRDEDGVLPLRLPADARIGVVQPTPLDLTPADTSARQPAALAAALRRHHEAVESIVTRHPPTANEIAALRDAASGFDVLVVGTIAASFDPAQAALVFALLSTGVPTITVALRTPFDLAAYPAARTHLCTYGLLPPSLEALADVLFGHLAPTGRLPAPVPGLYPIGHGVVPAWA